jgi:hypothetical protein
MTFHRTRGVLIAILAGLSCNRDPVPAASEGTASPPAQAAATLRALINAERARGGTCGRRGVQDPAPPLWVSPSLSIAAQQHARDMVARGYLAHRDLAGQRAPERARRAGYLGDVGENIAWQAPDAAAAFHQAASVACVHDCENVASLPAVTTRPRGMWPAITIDEQPTERPNGCRAQDARTSMPNLCSATKLRGRPTGWLSFMSRALAPMRTVEASRYRAEHGWDAVLPARTGVGVRLCKGAIAQQRLDPRPPASRGDLRPQVPPRLARRRTLAPRLREHRPSTQDAAAGPLSLHGALVLDRAHAVP